MNVYERVDYMSDKQVKPFLNKLFHYVRHEKIEIRTKKLKGFICLMEKELKKWKNSCSDSSSSGPRNYSDPCWESKKYELYYCKNAKESLSEADKQIYLQCLESLLIDFLEAKKLKDVHRLEFAVNLGIIYFSIKLSMVFKWIKESQIK